MKLRNLFFPLIVAALGLFGGAQSAQAQDFSDYVENKVVDLLLRGQTFSPPATVYVGLSTSACSDSSVGTEVSGGSYARAAVTSNLTNWAGTQGAGTTVASSGTGGLTSNNVAIPFATPSAGWGLVTHWFLIDSLAAGTNILVCKALTVSKTINSGDTVSFAIASLTLTVQ